MLKILFAITALVASSSVYAADGSSESTQSNIMDSVYLNYFGIFHGPGVNQFGEPYTPDVKTGNTVKTPLNSMNFDSEITAAYLITPTIGVGPVVPFFLYPVMGQGFTLGDVGIKAFNKKFITNHDLNVYANIIFQLPTSDYSKSPGRGMEFGIKMTPNVRYTVADSRFTVGAWTEQKAYMGVKSGKTFKLYAAPYINYQATPKFSWNLEYELEADHNYGNPNLDLTMFQNDLMPGFVYMVTPTVMVNPYFQIFTKDQVSLNHTAVGAVISASL